MKVGINGQNRSIVDGYIGINGENRKLKQVLVGINGQNEEVWSSAPPKPSYPYPYLYNYGEGSDGWGVVNLDSDGIETVKNTDHFYFCTEEPSKRSVWFTKDAIDITGYNKLIVNAIVLFEGDNHFNVDDYVDISALSGKYYCKIECLSGSFFGTMIPRLNYGVGTEPETGVFTKYSFTSKKVQHNGKLEIMIYSVLLE